MLHGLFGRATTWSDTARWLTPHFHVVGLDQRGHGWSDKPENAYSRAHYVNDAVLAIEQLGLGPTIVIGHSMGALNAWVVASQRPELVRGLVLEDMTAATYRPGGGDRVSEWLREWPLPFPSMAAVRAYFGQIRPGLAEYFMEVMAERPDGYWPLFQPAHMAQSAAQIDSCDHWGELDGIRCPALVVKGSESEYARAELQEMARRLPRGEYAEVAGAYHTVHYDQPARWRAVVEPFVLGPYSAL